MVYLLAYRRGFQGFRLIIVGIAVSAMLASLDTWLILKADLYIAMTAAVWGAGSLNNVGWAQVLTATVSLFVLWIALVPLARPLHAGGLGDDAARPSASGSTRPALHSSWWVSRSPRPPPRSAGPIASLRLPHRNWLAGSPRLPE